MRILDTNEEPTGAGFLVGDREIITCAHVVAKAIGISEKLSKHPWDAIRLDFPLIPTEQNLEARIVRWQPPGVNGPGDVVLLNLTGHPPPGALPIRLVSARDVWGHRFQTFGFPTGDDDGVHSRGELLGRQGTGWVQIEDVKGPGYSIQPGFSGSPVWDEELGGVVGMIVAAESRA